LNCSELDDRQCAGLLRKALQQQSSERYFVTVPSRDICLSVRRAQAIDADSERGCDQAHTINAKIGYDFDQGLRPMARVPTSVAIGKTMNIRYRPRLCGCSTAAPVTHPAGSAGDRVCQLRIAEPAGDDKR